MPKIETKIDTSSVKFKSNYEYHNALSDELVTILEKIREMGPSHRIEKHHKRGKLTARERIEKLKDSNTDFLEFSELAAYEIYDDPVPAAGIVTGIIEIHGHSCVVIANELKKLHQRIDSLVSISSIVVVHFYPNRMKFSLIEIILDEYFITRRE